MIAEQRPLELWLKGPIDYTGALLTTVRVTYGSMIEEIFLSTSYLFVHTVSRFPTSELEEGCLP